LLRTCWWTKPFSRRVFDDTATAAGQGRTFAESLEEHLVEIAFAEAADYNDIHEALLWERRMPGGITHPDDCQYGDNELCFLQR